jgi:mono/diheme cytochrome c family protein
MTSQAGQLQNKGHHDSAFKNFAVAILLFISMLTSACKPGPPPHITDPGQIIYLGYKDTYASCARCHGDEGQGSLQGPDIRKAIPDLSRKEIRKIIVFGKESDEYEEEMPALGEELTPEEIGFVIDFITHWGKIDSTAGKGLRDKQK